jgi:hypothetical protein
MMLWFSVRMRHCGLMQIWTSLPVMSSASGEEAC